MKVTVTLEQHLSDCRSRARAALTYTHATNFLDPQVDYCQGYLDALDHLLLVLPDFRESEANALSQYEAVYANPLA